MVVVKITYLGLSQQQEEFVLKAVGNHSRLCRGDRTTVYTEDQKLAVRLGHAYYGMAFFAMARGRMEIEVEPDAVSWMELDGPNGLTTREGVRAFMKVLAG